MLKARDNVQEAQDKDRLVGHSQVPDSVRRSPVPWGPWTAPRPLGRGGRTACHEGEPSLGGHRKTEGLFWETGRRERNFLTEEQRFWRAWWAGWGRGERGQQRKVGMRVAGPLAAMVNGGNGAQCDLWVPTRAWGAQDGTRGVLTPGTNA